MIAASSNKAVNVNARRLLRKLLQNNQSTDGIYRVLPDAYEAVYSTSEVGSRNYEEYLEDTYPTGTALRSISHDQYNQVADDPIRASLDAYLDAQLSGTDMDLFSLAKHIKNRLQVVALRGSAPASTSWTNMGCSKVLEPLANGWKHGSQKLRQARWTRNTTQ